jgi:chemotaxis signal transduction protein
VSDPGAALLDAPLERGRLITFEVAGVFYALPIAAVAEVAEVARIAAVPGVPREVAGVMNYHGDALPVLEHGALFSGPVGEATPPGHLLVLAERPDDVCRYGLGVDGICGLTDGAAVAAPGDDPVAERRPIEGRVVNILDPKRLLARAVQVIEQSVGSGSTGPADGTPPVPPIQGEKH